MAYKNYSEKFQQRDLELLKRERDRNVLRKIFWLGYFQVMAKKLISSIFLS